MRSLVIAAILVGSSGVATLFTKEKTGAFALDVESQNLESQAAGSADDPDSLPDPTVILESKSNKFGTYNIGEGTQGPFWSAQGIWNPSTKRYEGLAIAAGSTTVSGFSDTRGLLPGMTVEMTPDAMPANTTIVTVRPSSIVVSNASTKNGMGEVATFGLANDGVMFNQVITNHTSTFPRRTKIEWSYPSQTNDAVVYSYAIIAGYGVGSGGYPPTEQAGAQKGIRVHRFVRYV